jgi:putative ATPase
MPDPADDLFAAVATPRAPLAVRLRPRILAEILGQDHLLGPGSPLHRLVTGGGHSSVILWGPPGTGKTTIAQVIAAESLGRFMELSAVTAGVKDVREVMTSARSEADLYGRRTVLFLDEIHRFSKAQQDALLPGVENGWVTLVAATTENPSFSVIAALLSRSLLLTLRPLDEAAIRQVLQRALAAEPQRGGYGGEVTITEPALAQLVRRSGGDARRALTALEAAVAVTLATGSQQLDIAQVEQALAQASVRYDRAGDQHYDVVSAFIKSLRGSDPDAALHYLARMIEAGEDPRFIARRLMICASEDIGLADPSILPATVAAAQAVALIGFPEARIILAQVVIQVALAPKSNAAYLAIDRALADVQQGLASGLSGQVPAPMRDGHYPGATALGHGVGYHYPHDEPHGIVAQQYAPDAIQAREYYRPTEIGAERELGTRWQRIRALLRGSDGSS